MKSIWIVAKREVRTRLLAKASIISTLIFVVLIAGGTQVVGYFTDPDRVQTTTIAASEQTEPIAELAQGLDQGDLSYRTLPEADARELLTSGEVEMYIGGTPLEPVFMFDGSPDSRLLATGSEAAQQFLLMNSIDPADAAALQEALASFAPEVVDVNPVTADRDLDGVRIITAFVLISLLLFALIQSASLIIVGVIEEKSSRVVEILLATIRPAQLLAGKVLGIGIMGLIQVTVFAAAGIISAVAAGLVDLSELSLGASVLSLLGWFLLGFALYVSLFGGFSALVSRQEDAGVVTTPMVFGMMIPFYIAIYLIPNAPDATVTKVLSYIPFFAPFMMPVRVAFDAAATWEIWLAVGLCLLTIPAVIWLGGRVYSRAVLRTGGRVKLAEALRG